MRGWYIVKRHFGRWAMLKVPSRHKALHDYPTPSANGKNIKQIVSQLLSLYPTSR